MFNFSPLTNFIFDKALGIDDVSHLSSLLQNFNQSIYQKRPFTDNDGGMGLESSFFVWEVIRKIQPSIIVESGIWKGFTSFLFDRADSVDSIYCFDPVVKSPSFVEYKSPKATYFDTDWATPHFSFIDSSNSVAFFDDHQDQLERLLIAYARGYKYVLFDDNYFFGGGGHNGLATYMRNSPDILGLFVNNIWIAPPMIFAEKGLEPIFSNPDRQLESDINDIILKENNYNWLTLVELNKATQAGLSQIPGRNYIVSAYGRPM